MTHNDKEHWTIPGGLETDVFFLRKEIDALNRRAGDLPIAFCKVERCGTITDERWEAFCAEHDSAAIKSLQEFREQLAKLNARADRMCEWIAAHVQAATERRNSQ